MQKFVDLKKTQDEKQEYAVPSAASAPDYPYGLCISLTQDELEKLGVTVDDFDVEDLIDIRAFGVVTSLNESANSDHKTCRVEIQLTHLCLENENTENEDDENSEGVLNKLYKE